MNDCDKMIAEVKKEIASGPVAATGAVDWKQLILQAILAFLEAWKKNNP